MSTVKIVQRFPLFGIMFLIMFALKLAGIGVMAAASWWVVTAPLWVPLLLVAIMLIGVFTAFVLFGNK